QVSRNTINGNGQAGFGLIQVTNSRLSFRNNAVDSINYLVSADTTSTAFTEQNFRLTNNVSGILDSSVTSANLRDVAVISLFGNSARLHGEDVNPAAPVVYRINVTAITSFPIQIAAPSDSSDSGFMTKGQVFTAMVRNATGSTINATFYSAQFKTAGAFTNPAANMSRSITFVWDGSTAV